MKVILINNIEKVGVKGDVVNVKRGFARNYLVPRDLAIYATPQNLKKLEGLKKQYANEESKRIEQFKLVAKSISALKLTFTRKVGEHDSMYGSVSEMDILHELKEKDIDIPKTAVIMEKHIKQLGDFEIPIRLHKDVNVMLQVSVHKEVTEKDKAVKEPKVETPEVAVPLEPTEPAEATEPEEAETEMIDEPKPEETEEISE